MLASKAYAGLILAFLAGYAVNTVKVRTQDNIAEFRLLLFLLTISVLNGVTYNNMTHNSGFQWTSLVYASSPIGYTGYRTTHPHLSVCNDGWWSLCSGFDWS